MQQNVIDALEEEMLDVDEFFLESQQKIRRDSSHFLGKSQSLVGMRNQMLMVAVVQSISFEVFQEDHVLDVG